MPTLVENKKVRFDYEILETFEAGLELRGWEVKSIRNKKVSLVSSHAIIRGGEIYLVGMNIQPYQPNNMPADYEEQRTIKLFLTKKEINYIENKLSQKGLTLIPIKLYTKGSKIKIEIGLAKGKKKYDKREKIKTRETNRRIRREMKRGN